VADERVIKIPADGHLYGPGVVSPNAKLHICESVESPRSVLTISLESDQDTLSVCDWLLQISLRHKSNRR
jgi:hypothetical protein